MYTYICMFVCVHVRTYVCVCIYVHGVQVIGYHVLAHWGLIEKFHLNKDKVALWLAYIESLYCDTPYHNKIHATDVTQTCHAVLATGLSLSLSLSWRLVSLALSLGYFSLSLSLSAFFFFGAFLMSCLYKIGAQVVGIGRGPAGVSVGRGDVDDAPCSHRT